MRTRSRYYPPPCKRSLKKSTMQLIQEEAHKLHKTGEQFEHVSKLLDALEKRYNSAKKNKFKSFRYSLRLRLAVAEGVRNIYLEYARLKLEEMARLERILHQNDRNSLVDELIDLESWSDTDDMFD